MSRKKNARDHFERMFEIVDVRYSVERGEPILVVRNLHTSKTVEKGPDEICVKSRMLTGFSIGDIEMIRSLARKPLRYTVRQAIVGYEFTREGDGTVLQIQDRYTNTIDKKSVSELLRDKRALLYFSPLDAYRIGYFRGRYEVESEERAKAAARRDAEAATASNPDSIASAPPPPPHDHTDEVE